MHPHMVNGHLVAHSHPYQSGNCHSHTSASLESISVFNSVATSMLDTAQTPVLPVPVCVCVSRATVHHARFYRYHRSVACRAPPAV